MSRCRSKSARVLLAAMLALSGVPALASAVSMSVAGPVTTILLDPPAPNGSLGWYTTPPEVQVMSDTTGTCYYTWDGGAPASKSVAAGAAYYIDDAPEGYSTFAAHTTSLADVAGPTATVSLKVDGILPTMPDPFTATAGVSEVALSWGESLDTGSGVVGYTVYRNTVGPTFSQADAVASVVGTSWLDAAPPVADFVYYAVSARDEAGSESVLTAALAVTPDFAPPTTPGDLEAWFNASSWVRVSWLASFDVGSGIQHYLVYRSIDGGAPELVATVGGSTTYFDDHDDQVLFASTVEYSVVAVDRVGQSSATEGPVPMGSDVTPPAAPSAIAVTPVYSGTFTPAQFDVTWSAATDTGSGLDGTVLMWGPTSGVPANSQPVYGTFQRITAPDPTSLTYVQMRAEDRAGNLSVNTAPTAGRNVGSDRLSGATRIQTALAVSAAAFASADTVVVVSANSYPDALCASGLAGQVGGPVILAGAGPLPAATLAEIARLGAVDAFIVGGTGAVSVQTADSLAAALPGEVQRVWGANRYSTAAAVGDRIQDLAGMSPPAAFIVSGSSFADALSVAPAAYALRAPVLYALETSIPMATREAILQLEPERVVVAGGTGAVTAAAETLYPGLERLFGADRYATNLAFAGWAVSEGYLGLTSPVLATARDYPDGLVAGPLAGVRSSVLLLSSPYKAAAAGAWVASGRSNMLRVTTVGGTGAVSEAERVAVWQAVSVP